MRRISIIPRGYKFCQALFLKIILGSDPEICAIFYLLILLFRGTIVSESEVGTMLEYVIQIVARNVRHDFVTFYSYDEAFEYCTRNWWVYVDENEFVWDLEIVKRRELL